MLRSRLALTSVLLLACQTATFCWAQEDSASSKAALALYADAAGFQNGKQFDLASAEWQKFIDRYPQHPRALEARYNLAVCEIQEEKFQPAIDNLKQVVAKADKDFDRIQDAYLNLGWSLYSLAQANQPQAYGQASAVFADLLAKYPNSKFRDQALFFGGESLYLQGKLKEATQSYQELVSKHEDSELYGEGLYALGVALEDQKEHEKAGQVFDRFLKKYPEHELTTEVRMRKAETILQAGRYREAAKLFQEVADTKGFRAEDHARYRQAFCIAQAGDYGAAAKLFAQIATDMPNSSYAKDAAIAAGRAFFRADAFDEASKWFQKILAANNEHSPEAAHWLARILLDKQQPDEARALLAKVIPTAKKHPFYVNLLLDDADAQYETPATRSASVTAYLRVAQEYPKDPLAAKALYNAAYGAMEQGDYKNSLTYAARFTQAHVKHALLPEVRKVIAECKLQLGELDEAAKEFGKLAASGDKDGTKFELRRGLSLFLDKKYDEALQVLSRVYENTQTADEKAEAAYWLGRSLAGKKQYEQAIKRYQQSLQANPQWKQADEVLLNLALAEKRKGDLEAAETTLMKLIAGYTDSQVLDQAHYRLADFSYGSADYPTAIENYTKVLDNWPDSKLVPFSLYGRGWAWLRSGDAKQATADFAHLQEDYPQHELIGQTTYALGMSLHQGGQHEQALRVIEAYLESSPEGSSKSDALYLKGLCNVGLKRYAAAVQTFQTLLEDAPSYNGTDKVLYELAWAAKNQGNPQQAQEAFSKLTERYPDSPLTAEAYYHLGESSYAAKAFQDALPLYTSAARLAKGKDLKEKAAYKLGWTNYQLKAYEKAIEAFDGQLTISGSSGLAADAEFMRAESLFKQGKHEAALTAYERAKDKPAKNVTMQALTYLHAAQAAGQLKQWDASIRWIEQLQEKLPSSPYQPQATYELGWAQRNLGQLNEALESFNAVSAKSRNELGARARFMAGEVLFEKKDYAAAILEFRRVMFGYGADKAPDSVKQWQSKSGFEAGRCASVLAGAESDAQRRSKLLQDARGFFQYVAEKHANSTEADAARKQLERLTKGETQVSRR